MSDLQVVGLAVVGVAVGTFVAVGVFVSYALRIMSGVADD